MSTARRLWDGTTTVYAGFKRIDRTGIAGCRADALRAELGLTPGARVPVVYVEGDLEGGEETVFSIFAQAHRLIEFPAAGIVIRDRLGQAVFTEGTTLAFDGAYQEEGLRFEPHDRVRIDFHFVMPVLGEGEYSISVAVAEGFGHDHVQHHLIHDALALRSLASPLLHGIAGFAGARMRIALFRETEHDRA